MWKMEFEFRPVFGSVKLPDALHRGSSGNRSRNLSSCFLKLETFKFEMALIFGGRQFHSLLAVSANDESRGIVAGLWCRIWLGSEHL